VRRNSAIKRRNPDLTGIRDIEPEREIRLPTEL
jgi:hypothetical protein